MYLALEEEFDLQYGKVLIALSSKDELEDMLDKEWPFFDKYLQEVILCLNGTTCGSMTNIVAMLGKKKFRFLCRFAGSMKKPSLPIFFIHEQNNGQGPSGCIAMSRKMLSMFRPF